jgi:hypothetical protein
MAWQARLALGWLLAASLLHAVMAVTAVMAAEPVAL